LLSGTHQRIGMTILNSLKQQSTVDVAVEEYLFGCIKPDFSLGAFYPRHLKHEAFDFVLDTIMEIESVPWPKEGKARKSFSTRLGVVMHYLADFFCHAHNTKMGDLMPWHFAYEAHLHIVSRKIDLDCLAQELVTSLMPSQLPTIEGLRDFLLELHQRYLTTEQSAHTDLYFALAAGTAATYYVLSACQRPAVRPAA